jgi:hypothetical protein
MMSAVPRCHVVYALLICSLVSPSGFAAAIEQPGGEGAPVSASVAAGGRPSAALDVRQSPTVHDGRFVAPHRDFGPLRGATGNIAKPAIAAVRPDLSRRLDVAAGARGLGAASSGASGRPFSTVLSTASTVLSTARRSVAGVKPLAAGNGAVGGPRTAVRGMLGGAVNGNSVLKASIDGNALRRRF